LPRHEAGIFCCQKQHHPANLFDRAHPAKDLQLGDSLEGLVRAQLACVGPTCTWEAPAPGILGSFTVTARAFDAHGRSATAEPITILVVVDITGVPAIDTQTAQHLIDTVSAVRLLGSRVILTGVRPSIAQTLIHLGIAMEGITTRASFAGGLRVAMEMLALEVTSAGGSSVSCRRARQRDWRVRASGSLATCLPPWATGAGSSLQPMRLHRLRRPTRALPG
jgi:anti-anti-sigma regulatory factor